MKLQQAKALAHQWVQEEATNLPGFYGAFFHGSVNWLSDDAVLAPSSDLDIMVVFHEPPSIKLGKIVYHGLLLEVSYMASAALQSAEEILATSHLAGSFHRPSVIADPTGELTQLQRTVAASYAKREWVLRRCEGVEAKLRRNLGNLDASAPFHSSVTSWLFGTSLTTHILLVAGLKNPTVRKRYVATQALLEEYGQAEFQETLLAMIGGRHITPSQVQSHLDALTPVFDVTGPLIQTPVFFASDLSQAVRPVAIDGSQQLIDSGLHREALFWIVATYARCLHVLHVDGTPEQYSHYTTGFQQILGDLGINAFADLTSGAKKLQGALPKVWSVANSIISSNREIKA